jgi:hypothetical protein
MGVTHVCRHCRLPGGESNPSVQWFAIKVGVTNREALPRVQRVMSNACVYNLTAAKTHR